MKLTGKCKEDFEKWFDKTHEVIELPSIDDSISFSSFKDLPQSMQYGVYVDFFDSVGIIADIHPIFHYDESTYTSVTQFLVYCRELNVPDPDSDPSECRTRPDAFNEFVRLSNKIYNRV